MWPALLDDASTMNEGRDEADEDEDDGGLTMDCCVTVEAGGFRLVVDGG